MSETLYMGISTQNRETDRQTETGRQAGRQPGRQRHTLRRWTVLDTITSGSLQHAYCEMVHHKVDTILSDGTLQHAFYQIVATTTGIM